MQSHIASASSPAMQGRTGVNHAPAVGLRPASPHIGSTFARHVLLLCPIVCREQSKTTTRKVKKALSTTQTIQVFGLSVNSGFRSTDLLLKASGNFDRAM